MVGFDLLVKLGLTCSSNKIIFFPRGRKEGGDSEERKPIALARPFLRHRLSSKDDESQKIPGLYQNVANEDLAMENFVFHLPT